MILKYLQYNLNKFFNNSSVCNKYIKFKNTEISYISKKALSLSIVHSKCGHEYEKIFKEEEPLEILKILGLINIIEEYQKVYDHI